MAENKDDAAVWWDSRNANIQDFEKPENPQSFVNLDEKQEQEPQEQSEMTNKEVKSQLNMLKLNEPTAQIVTNLLDSLVPVVFVLIIKDIDQEQIKLTDNERESITTAWAQYLRDANVQMSPGMVLLGTIGVVYGSKITLALANRKKDKEAELKEKKYIDTITELEKRLSELEEKENEA